MDVMVTGLTLKIKIIIMENKIYKLTDGEFINLVKSSLNIAEVLFKLGYTVKGNSWGYSQIKQRMVDLNLSGKDFRGKSGMLKCSEQLEISQEDLFRENSRHSRNILRKHIIKNNLLEYKCAICGIKEWNGKTLSLELDHINGINNDNRLENLRFLCPNCHSQTSTYGARNKQYTESRYELSEELSERIIQEYLSCNNKKKVSEKLGIARKAVDQCLKENKFSKPNQKYVIQYDKDHNEIKRFGSIAECCSWIMDNDLVRTKLMKTCRATLNRNAGQLWNNYYFEILDA